LLIKYKIGEYHGGGRVALVNKVFMGATGKTKFARALYDIVFIEMPFLVILWDKNTPGAHIIF
jgi:hypothetical protein